MARSIRSLARVGVCAWWATTLLAAQSPPPSNPFDDLVARGSAAREAGRFTEAIEAYRRAIELKPSWAEGSWTLAMLLYHVDDYKEARDLFQQVAGQVDTGLPLAMKGLCEFRLANHAQALEDLQAARRLGIEDAEVGSVAEFHTALLLNHAGNPDGALEILSRFAREQKEATTSIEAMGLAVLRLPYLPDEIPAEKREMVLLAGRGGYHMARVRRSAIGRLAFEELVSRYPTAPNVHYAFGTYLLPEEPDAAIEEFRKELRLSPGHYPSMLQIALAETRRGNARAAVPLAERAVQIAPDAPAGRLMLGRALLDMGETDRAIEELEHGLRLAPDTPGFYFSLGIAYQRAGRSQDAARARAEFQRLERGGP